jgi:hypothetical protein
MLFLSQFPAAREFLVKIVKHSSNGWAQGFIFSFSEDRPQNYEDDGDDEPVLDFFAEVLEIISRAYGPRVPVKGPVTFSAEALQVYKDLHNMVQRCKQVGNKEKFAADLQSNFSKFPQWGPSYCFASHALGEALRYGRFRRQALTESLQEINSVQRALHPTPGQGFISSAYKEAWRFYMLGDAAVHHCARFFVTLQKGVQVLVSEAGVRQNVPAGLALSPMVMTDEQLLGFIYPALC